MSLQSVYESVKGLIATNLATMGVTGYSSSDGLTTLANAILDIEGGGNNLSIDIDLALSSSSIDIGNSVNLTATLTASYDGTTVDLSGVLQGATITFKDGNTTIGTGTTNSSGVATYSGYSPSTTGTKTISAIFTTTDGFSGATDSTTLTVSKVTPSLSMSLSPSSTTTSGTVTVSGVLTYNSTGLTGKGISIQCTTTGGSQWRELTFGLTSIGGSYSINVDLSDFSWLSAGTYDVKAVFVGESTFNSVDSSTTTLTITSPTPVTDSISLTSDKSILSYADSESATLSATVLDSNDDPVSGETVEFFNGSTSMGTATTNASGVATKVYNSIGAGDVSFTAEVGSLVSGTFVVQDCKDYISGETDQSTKFGSSITLRTGSSILSYDSTNKHYILTVGTAGESFLPIQSCTGLDDFTLEFDAQVNYNSAYGVGSVIYSASNNWGAIGVHQQSCTYGKTVNGTYTYSSETVSITGNTWLHFKITVTDDKVKLEILNGTTLISSHTKTYDSSWFNNSTKYGLDHMWSSGRATPFKNIKIKHL